MEKIKNKIIMEKSGNLPYPPKLTGKINSGNNGQLNQLSKKKKNRIISRILKTLIGKKCNYRKIGRRHRLFKLNGFFCFCFYNFNGYYILNNIFLKKIIYIFF
jgi:hypothetical protein